MTSLAFDPLELSVMSHAFAMIAEEMGTILVRGALSPNIRERRDASSALFDAREVGRLKRPSTALGLIFHAAEHSSRHAGQIVTLNRIVRAA